MRESGGDGEREGPSPSIPSSLSLIPPTKEGGEWEREGENEVERNGERESGRNGERKSGWDGEREDPSPFFPSSLSLIPPTKEGGEWEREGENEVERNGEREWEEWVEGE